MAQGSPQGTFLSCQSQPLLSSGGSYSSILGRQYRSWLQAHHLQICLHAISNPEANDSTMFIFHLISIKSRPGHWHLCLILYFQLAYKVIGFHMWFSCRLHFGCLSPVSLSLPYHFTPSVPASPLLPFLPPSPVFESIFSSIIGPLSSFPAFAHIFSHLDMHIYQNGLGSIYGRESMFFFLSLVYLA